MEIKFEPIILPLTDQTAKLVVGNGQLEIPLAADTIGINFDVDKFELIL
jgi:hypothetical protein